MLQNTLKLFKKYVCLPSLHYQGLISEVQDLRRWHVLFYFLVQAKCSFHPADFKNQIIIYSFLGSDSHPSLLVLDV